MIQQARFLATQARDPSPIGAYEHSTPGFNYRLSNVLAAIGRGQLRVLPDRVEARRRIFERYREGLRDIEQISWMPEAGYGRGTRWLSCGQVRSAEQRDQLLKHLDENGIEARPAWKPMHLQPLFAVEAAKAGVAQACKGDGRYAFSVAAAARVAQAEQPGLRL